MALGLSITSKVTRIWPGGPVALDLHQHLSILGLLFSLFHVVILLADHAIDFTLAKAFLPFFGSSYRPMWYGLMGKFALYLLAILTLSFYVRSRIGGRWWRLIHYSSFAMFVLTLLHGVLAGSDTHELWARLLYIATTSSLIGLTIYRIAKTRRIAASEVAQLRVGKLTLDPIKRVVTVNNSQTTLRSIEARLLYFFMQNAGQLITHDEILTKVWGRQYVGEPHLAKLYIRRLRTKIEQDPANPLHIRTSPEGSYQFEG
jgi:predicted ferric reductase